MDLLLNLGRNCLYSAPQVENLRTVSATVAVEIARKAESEGLARMKFWGIHIK